MHKAEIQAIRAWASKRLETARRLATNENPLTVEGQTKILKKQGQIAELEFIATDQFLTDLAEAEAEELNGRRSNSR